MNLKVNIKNFGKLIDADIRIGKFTVFAGLNNTGKSFASKALYSRLSGRLEDVNFLNILAYSVDNLQQSLDNLKNKGFIHNLEFFEFLQNLDEVPKILQNLDEIEKNIAKINNMQLNEILELEETDSAIVAACKSIEKIRKDMDSKINSYAAKNEVADRDVRHGPVGETQLFFDMLGAMAEMSMKQNVKSDIQIMFTSSFLQNFQVQVISELKNDRDKDAHIKIGEKSLIFDKAISLIDSSSSDIADFFIADKAFYLGSPLFWQLKNPLESVGDRKKRLPFGRQRLSGVPKYFYDMVAALREQYTGESIFSDVANRLTGEHAINGKVSVAATGEMIYTENNGVAVPLMRAATGVVNMGVLALLIEKNILDENTFLFIDEPEAHLHPAWQVEIAEALFKLADKGVNVVIATHSVDIIKWLEVHVKKDPKAKDKIALNHFSQGKVKSIDKDEFDSGLAEIKMELTDPFAILYRKGLRHDLAG